MADINDSSTQTPDSAATTPVPSARSTRITRKLTAMRVEKATARDRRRAAGKPHPVRSFLTVTAVAGMVATVAIPAFAAARGTSAEAALTVEQVAADNAQSLVVASEATPAALERDSYAATTPEEIEEKKAEEAAAEAAKAALAARLASSGTAASVTSSVPATIAVSGDVVRPLPHFNNFGTPYAGHKGTDYMVGGGTPIYSIADGVVVASSESGPGWGVYVKIAHNIGGQSVTSLYAHMTYGTRRVSVGDTVSAGQLIGQVGATGRAYGTHLHLEVVVGGVYQNPESWLVANAG